jgi:hypothetical protein
MASTTTVTATETIYAKILASALIEAMYSVAVMDPLVRQESLVGKPSLNFSFAVWPSLTAASIAETTDLASTAVDTTNVDIAVSEAAAIRIDVTDLLAESSIVTGAAAFADQGAKAVADKRDTDLAALLGGFSGVNGATNTVLTEATVLDALTALEAADAPRPYCLVLHPYQVGQLRKAVSTTTGVVHTNTRPEDLVGEGNGFEFSYYGIPVYASTNVPTANANADRAGALFSRGQALARVDKRPIRMGVQRDESLRATEFNITSVYGQGELVDAWGRTIISKNAVS